MLSFFRRTLTMLMAASLLLLLLPLMCVIGLLVWSDDGRPILFRQARAGKEGTPFEILKFRTLTTDAKGTQTPSQHTTSAGAFLRRWALDELPQLWNIVRGDMNLIGPRPVLLEEARGYDERARRRLDVRPGLTGWSQVHGRNNLDWTKRMALDLWYVRNQSLLVDLWILFKTPLVLLSGKGVYGPGTKDPSTSNVHSHLQS